MRKTDTVEFVIKRHTHDGDTCYSLTAKNIYGDNEHICRGHLNFGDDSGFMPEFGEYVRDFALKNPKLAMSFSFVDAG